MDFPIETKFFKKYGPTRIRGRGPRLLSSKCFGSVFEGFKYSQEHSTQKSAAVLQDQEVEPMPTQQELESELRNREIRRFELGQLSGLCKDFRI